MNIEFNTRNKKMLADILTPVSLYLKIRDRFPGSILLESSDYHGIENSYSFICLEPVASVKAERGELIKQYPDGTTERTSIDDRKRLVEEAGRFIFSFKPLGEKNAVNGFFGYTSYDAVRYFEKVDIGTTSSSGADIPDMFYSLYRYIISVNLYKNELIIIENEIGPGGTRFEEVVQLIESGKLATYPFSTDGDEETNTDAESYLEMVKKGKHHCRRGDVFQIVLSRGFSRNFIGDDFNVYRALRNINPSPYLFFFDFGTFRLFGSSPEAQITIKNNIASINPIAGTFRRTGNDIADRELAVKLSADPKENAEHVMLVDLARNDLSRSASDVYVEVFREVQYYSHVIHLVSKVSGNLDPGTNPLQLLADTFPAGTLSGAPKVRAMELIDDIETDSRGFYGGCIGYIGFNGELNHAILIRSFLSKNNVLHYRAGAGIVERSVEETELAEVDNKVEALRAAIQQATNI